MVAGHVMKRSARFAAALLLAGLVQISLPGVVWAENRPWELESSYVPVADQFRFSVTSLHMDGGMVILFCLAGNPKSNFGAGVFTESGDEYPNGEVAVSWRIDKGTVHDEIWTAVTSKAQVGVVTIGDDAYDFALAVASAQNRIVFRNPNGRVVFDAKGSTKAISQLLGLCGLKQ